MIRYLLRTSTALAVAVISWSTPMSVHAADSNTGESSEVLFCNGGTAPYAGCDAADLRAKANALASPVAIFEYMRNNYDYSLYHGARSGSVNTFLGGRGSDVDLAATLIAMLRSQGIPARYVVGTVRVPATQVANWLQVEDASLAQSVMIDLGLQKVVSSTSGSTATIDFEHVWVEALVPYGQYRGAGAQSPTCTGATPPAACHWVPLDPSFKQYKYANSGLDPYAGTVNGTSVGATNFDYSTPASGYYYVLKNTDAASVAKRNKNPLEIYQEQVLSWLGTNAAGKTLQDIPNFQGIVAEINGLLPASLPFAVVGATRNYNSVTDHDAVVPVTEPKKWGKTVRLSIVQPITVNGITKTFGFGGGTTLLTDATTKRLTISPEVVGSSFSMVVRLGGVEIARPISFNNGISGYTPTNGDPFTLHVEMDGAPAAASSGSDEVIKADYEAMVGGYYLIATGGETSNWSQVHRAAQQLLAANQQYPIVFNPADPGVNGQSCDRTTGLNCTPYADISGNGWDASDPKLQDSRASLDALTGGLLYVAATQYYAKTKDGLAALDAINKIKTPISGFLGVVSSTYQPEYINGTAFSILPSGLLIDMKGIKVAGAWRINAPATNSSTHFSLAGHVLSSLEHEIWQELTGYDAISTVRGIQIALANGGALLNPKVNSSQDTMAATYAGFGFVNGSAPAGFTYAPFDVYGTSPATWTHASSGASFEIMRAKIDATIPSIQWARDVYTYYPTSGIYGWVSCVNSHAVTLNGYVARGAGGQIFNNWPFCDGTKATASINDLINAERNMYLGVIIPNYIGQQRMDYYDRLKGFSPSAFVYRAAPVTVSAIPADIVQSIRTDLYTQPDVSKSWREYVIPSLLSIGPTFKFVTYIQNNYDVSSGSISDSSYIIKNQSGVANGGYVGW